MNDTKYHDIEFYENYIFGRLSSEKEDLFEEHLLMCPICQEELKILEGAVSVSKRQSLQTEKKIGVKKTVLWRLTGTAASILLLVSIGMLLHIKRNENKIVEIPVVTDSIHTITKPQEVIIAQENKPIFKEETKPTNVNPKFYKLSPVFENAIKNQTRSAALEFISPKLSETYQANDTIVFNWKTDSDDLTLVVFNNIGKIIFEQDVTLPFHYSDIHTKGLYYWQIESEVESIYTGKIFIR